MMLRSSSMPSSKPFAVLVASVLATALLLPAEAFAHGSCTGARMKNIGKRCRSIARCYVSQALGRGDAASCVAYELQRLERHFQESEIYPDCHEFGDPADVIAALDSSMSDVADLLLLGSDRCSRSKMDAAGKLCLHLLRDCEAAAEVAEMPVDPACTAGKSAMLQKLFDKAELKGGCPTTDDEAAVESTVQGGVDAVVTELTVP